MKTVKRDRLTIAESSHPFIRLSAKIVRHIRHELEPLHFECIPGCSDCCHPTPWSIWEYNQLNPNERAIAETYRQGDTRCPFSSGAGCQCYHQRPVTCRLYGVTGALRCPHGRGPKRLLTKRQARRLMERYWELVREEKKIIAVVKEKNKGE